MSGTQLAPETKGLTGIIKAEAKMAMPEIVQVFLAKYENDLYEQKESLQLEMAELTEKLKKLNTTVLDSAKFKQWKKIKIPKLELESVLSPDKNLDWANEIVTCSVVLQDMRTQFIAAKRVKVYEIGRVVEESISQLHLKQYREWNARLDEVRGDLAKTATAIGDMSRKERQVKARISELRLEEAGLTDFLQDKEMLKLIEIK